MSTVAELTERAEAQLLLADFVQAESLSRQALQRAVYLGDESLKDRAACVAIQALAETQRFAGASRLLRDSCGPQLEDAPPHAALLWLALALDTEDRREAQRLMLALLDLRQPGGEAGWSRRQYLQLAHLYAFEVLLKELREVAEVMRWVEETEVPLDTEERQLLLAELAAEAEAAAALRRQEQARQRGGGFDVVGGGARQSDGATAAAAGRHCGEGAQQWAQPPAASQSGKMQELAGSEAAAGGLASYAAAGAGAIGARAAARAPAAPAGAESEIVPALPDEAEAAAGLSPLDWLALCQQQAAAALGAALQPLLPTAGRGSGTAAGVPADPAATLRLLGGTCLGAVLLYAAYIERRAIRRGAQRARRGVAAMLSDLARMALSLQVNPLAASAPGWR